MADARAAIHTVLGEFEGLGFPATSPATAGSNPFLLPFDTLDPQTIDWIWPRWIPKSALTLISGPPGIGKSTVAEAIAAALSAGGALPDGTTAPTARVLLLAREDTIAVSRHRLALHGANLANILALTGRPGYKGNRLEVSIRNGRADLVKTIAASGIDVLIIDPLEAFTNHSAAHARDLPDDVLNALDGIIEESGVTVLAVTHLAHAASLRKREDATLLGLRARSVIGVTNAPASLPAGDTGDEGARKILVVTKANYSIPPAPIAFHRPLDAPIAWLGETTATPLADLPAGPAVERAPELAAAISCLRTALSTGDMPCQQVYDIARWHGITIRTLRRARAVIGVSTYRGEQGNWTWSLPEPDRACVISDDTARAFNRCPTADSGA
jgi:nucleoside-triphosphatase THEP1